MEPKEYGHNKDVIITILFVKIKHAADLKLMPCVDFQRFWKVVHFVQKKSSVLKCSKSRTGCHVTWSCLHASSRFTFPLFVHWCMRGVINCNEWKTEKLHEWTNMGKIKRLELWWQLYVMSLPERKVRNFMPLDFCWTECTYNPYW